MSKYSPFVEQTVATAIAEAQRQRSSILGTPHLFIAAHVPVTSEVTGT